MSHSKIGWHEFTNDVIRTISDRKDHVVFLLWGSFAKSKQELIDKNKHLVLTAPHPSPLSAYNGFFGCGHFSKTNQWLQSKGLKPIDWSLDNN
jgi:uracil-DNA glycosylase